MRQKPNVRFPAAVCALVVASPLSTAARKLGFVLAPAARGTTAPNMMKR